MKRKILVVEDNDLSRELLCDILEDDYEIEQAENGERALNIINAMRHEISCILLDLVMPGMSGLDVLDVMNKNHAIKEIPVLVISGESDRETEQKCFEKGAFDFVHKPYEPIIARMRIKNAISLYSYQNSLEQKVEEQTRELVKLNNDIIDLMGNLVEARNQESGQHIKRVKGYSRLMAQAIAERYPEYKLEKRDIDLITSASSLHDVGKIMIPDNILLKPGKLTAEEFEIMKTHSEKGCSIIDNAPLELDRDFHAYAHDICLYHHERFVGRGYPEKLVGDDIPIAAQIVAVADCCDALSSDSVYKKAFPMDKTFDMILGGECGTFNPKLLECFEAMRADITAFHDSNRD